jgi:hypothetical protein
MVREIKLPQVHDPRDQFEVARGSFLAIFKSEGSA